MYRERALSRAASFFGKSRTSNDKTHEGKQGIFRGSDTPTATKCCISFNLGKAHPASSLLPNGNCRFAHKCDHPVIWLITNRSFGALTRKGRYHTEAEVGYNIYA